jgi:AraC-like DNA-binding protein
MLLYISLLLVLLAVILIVYNWKLNNNAVFIGLFFSLIAIYGLTHYFAVYGKSAFWLALFYNHFSPFFLLAGPFLYFYVRGTLKDRQGLKRKDAIHFVPALIHLIGVIPYFLSSFEYKESVAKMIVNNVDTVKKIRVNIFFDSEFNFTIRLLFLTIYVIFSFILLRKFSKKKNKFQNTPRKQYIIITRWLNLLLTLVSLLIINFVILCYYFLYFEESHLKDIVIIINSTTGISFVFLAFGVLLFPEILYGLPNNNLIKSKIATKKIKNNSSKSDITITPLSDFEEDPFLKLSDRIKEYFENEKPYLNPDFSIAQISLKLNVPQNHVLYCVNSIFKIKFSKLKTKLRVEQTKVFLQESVHSNITIDGISQLAGFSSRSSFYNAFKEETGITPSDYLKSITSNSTDIIGISTDNE